MESIIIVILVLALLITLVFLVNTSKKLKNKSTAYDIAVDGHKHATAYSKKAESEMLDVQAILSKTSKELTRERNKAPKTINGYSKEYLIDMLESKLKNKKFARHQISGAKAILAIVKAL